MSSNLLFPAISVLILISNGNCANIFFFFGLSTQSHTIAVWPLVLALADRGHNITFASGYTPRQPDTRIREFHPGQFKAKIDAQSKLFGKLFAQRIEKGRFGVSLDGFVFLPERGYAVCSDFLEEPETQELLRNSKFDLVIFDGMHNDCALGMAAKWGAKTISFGTTHPFPWTLEPFGVVPETSIYPEYHFAFPYPMSLLEKTFGTLVHLAWYFHRQYVTFPKLESLLREKLNFTEMPALADLERQVGLVLYNSHFSEELARSLPPFFVAVGGMHCELPKDQSAMPKKIQKFIEDSDEAGFILVNFGSLVSLSDTQELQSIFFTAFERSKIRFILKWNGEPPKYLPPNVLTVGWFSQNEVLASKNMKAFITHGGLLSIHEAVTHGVPMIALPIFAEQDYNAFRLERTGRGIRLELATLTVEQLQDAISKILNNKSYKQNVEKVSKLFKDRPTKPVETAVWWTEYVLRHEDTEHLKSLGMDQFWFQRRLLDVWAFLAIVLVAFGWLSLLILKKITRSSLSWLNRLSFKFETVKSKAFRENDVFKKHL